jgi:hypothetical protein
MNVPSIRTVSVDQDGVALDWLDGALAELRIVRVAVIPRANCLL